MNKFETGDRVKVVNYGYKSYSPSINGMMQQIDTCPELIGWKGVVMKVSNSGEMYMVQNGDIMHYLEEEQLEITSSLSEYDDDEETEMGRS